MGKTALCAALYGAGIGIMAALVGGAVTGGLAMALAPLAPALLFAGLGAHLTANIANKQGGPSSLWDCAQGAFWTGLLAYGVFSWVFAPHLNPGSLYSSSAPPPRPPI